MPLRFGNRDILNICQAVERNRADIELLKQKPNLSISIVEELPEVGQEGILYLVPSEDPELENAYDEYVWLPESESFELVGTTAIDLSNMVTTDTEQEITGSKTFSSPIIAADGVNFKDTGLNWTIKGDETYDELQIDKGTSPMIKMSNSQIMPRNEQSLGTATYKFSNLHLKNSVLLGNNTTAGQGQITFKNPDVSNQGNWYITSPDQSGLSIMQDTQNTGIKISRGSVYPLTTQYFELGSGSYRWKSLHLSHYVTWGNNVLIGKDSSNRFYVTDSSGNTKIKVGTNETYFANHVEPDSTDTYDLGRSAARWRYAYVNYLVDSQGNTIKTDDIALKSTSQATEEFASGTLGAGTGQDTIDLTITGMPDDGIYMFTYGNAQTMLYLDSTMIQNAALYPIRVTCPVLKESGGVITGNTGNLKISRSGDILTITVASTVNGSATSTNGWGWKLFKTGL